VNCQEVTKPKPFLSSVIHQLKVKQLEHAKHAFFIECGGAFTAWAVLREGALQGTYSLTCIGIDMSAKLTLCIVRCCRVASGGEMRGMTAPPSATASRSSCSSCQVSRGSSWHAGGPRPTQRVHLDLVCRVQVDPHQPTECECSSYSHTHPMDGAERRYCEWPGASRAVHHSWQQQQQQ